MQTGRIELEKEVPVRPELEVTQIATAQISVKAQVDALEQVIYGQPP